MTAELLTLLIGVSVRAAIVLTFAWVVTAAMRRASASARHLVWTCAIAASALVPAAAFAPRWEVTTPVALTSPAIVVLAPGTAASTTPSARQMPSASVAPTRRPQPLNPADIVLLVWTGGTVAVLLYLSAGFIGTWRLRRRAIVPDAALAADVNALAEALDVARPIAVVHSELVASPMVFGIWRPLIVMPRAANGWPDERRYVVLLHELAHIKRRDCLTQLLAQVVCAAYWFNPLAWIAARRLRAEREHACDDFVLAAGTRGSEYADHLLDIAQAVQPARFSPIAATAVSMARRSQLEGRLMAILDPATRRSSAFYTRLAVASLVALVSIPAAAIQLVPPSDRGVRLQPDQVALQPTASAQPQAVQPGPASQGAILLRLDRANGAVMNQEAPPARATPDEIMRYTLNRSLIDFAEDGHLNGVTAMLDAGADVNAEILGDGTALHAAAGEGHLDVVRLLLDRGANPNLVVRGEGSPLTQAAGEGHLEVVELLLQRGADVSLVAEGDETALIQAAGDGHLDVVKLLVSKGADVNQGVMAERYDVDVLFFLGDRAAATDRQRPARSGPELRTPLREAREEGHVDVVTFLISAGARD